MTTSTTKIHDNIHDNIHDDIDDNDTDDDGHNNNHGDNGRWQISRTACLRNTFRPTRTLATSSPQVYQQQ